MIFNKIVRIIIYRNSGILTDTSPSGLISAGSPPTTQMNTMVLALYKLCYIGIKGQSQSDTLHIALHYFTSHMYFEVNMLLV